jgi:CheY-like chemotaxis protein/glycine cleavage system H lipoate-binding protein
MTALFVVSLVVAFVVLDVLVRIVSRRWNEARARREREALLATSLRLDFTHDAKSLKRVEVPGARARILAVDDEPIVLDSFRKILTLNGFSIDTVETGPEALGLVQRHDYDFVFTDLKMADMDGVEVVKAVRHLRPDVDVVVITGYATIESAVETAQHGAVDYVQKPFTEEELLRFLRKLVVRREARLEAQRRPTVRVVPPPVADGILDPEYCVPGGFFVSDGHAWMRIEPDGEATIGLDDFARKALRFIDAIELPRRGQTLLRGAPLFGVRHEGRGVRFASPVSGEVVRINERLDRDPSSVMRSPYDQGWVCGLRPSDLAGELSALRIGQQVVAWYQDEIARYREAGTRDDDAAQDHVWKSFGENFLGQ